ncbi:YncE family protein [Novosphingobium sp.]|uniref:YncE family protein n=1 Tax=Novosphingobium sp. TaxID=1874826 RepID=UPI0033422D14
MRIALKLLCSAIAITLAAPVMADTAPAAPVSGAPVYAVVARIPGADGGWDYAAVDPVRGRLYVARTDAVMAVDLASGKVTDHFAPATRAHAALPIDQGRTLLETDGTSGLTRFIDADSGKTLAEVATGKKPDAAFVDHATGLVVVMNPGSNSVALIDPKTHALVRAIAVPGGLEAGEGDGHGHAWVNLEEANALAEIDLKAGTLVRTVALDGCDGPTGLALIGGATRVLSACSNGVVTVVDTASGKLVQTLAVGAGPDAVIVDGPRGLAFVPSGQAGTLSAISIADPAHLRVVATIPTQKGARTGAVDPRTGILYLPTATMVPAANGTDRPRPAPGSFVVLVVAPKPVN